MITARPEIETISPYQGGKPIEEVQREFKLNDIIKLASNENPLGPSPKAVAAMQKAVDQVNLYPDGNAYYLKKDLAEHLGVDIDQIILGNGSNEVLHIIGETFVKPNDEIIYSESAFVVYKLVAAICGAKAVVTPMNGYHQDISAIISAITNKTKIIFIANPNNPTGTMVNVEQAEELLASVPEHVLVVFDEAYGEYIDREDYPRTLSYIQQGHNVLVSRTFSKIHGLAGLRIGYGIADNRLVGLMNRVRQPFNCNLLAQVSARAALADTDYVLRSKQTNDEEKHHLYKALAELSVDYVPSEGNFIMLNLSCSGEVIAQKLLEKGIIVRPITGYGFPNSVRLTIGTNEQNRRFIETLSDILEIS